MTLERLYTLYTNFVIKFSRYSSGVERFLGKEKVPSSNLGIGSLLFFIFKYDKYSLLRRSSVGCLPR